MTHLVASRPRSGSRGTAGTVAGVALAILAAAAANTAIAALAVAAGAVGPFPPLNPASYVPLTIFGVVAGAVGWGVVRRRATNPSATLRWLVPVVVALTFIPDVGLLLTDVQPNTSVLGVGALAMMHLVTAAISVAIFLRIMPIGPR